MTLKHVNIKYKYRSSECNIVDEFYIPSLKNSIEYRRAVGYFTSNSLALASKGLVEFIKNNGKMKLVASPMFNESDIEAIKKGYETKYDVVKKALLRELVPTEDEIIKYRLSVLSWLIAKDLLEIKIAVVKDIDKVGIYHEKIGIFIDEEENKVAFIGSSNETSGGIYSNFESIQVFCSWRQGDEIRVEDMVIDFDMLWNNSTDRLEIIEFPEAVKDKLLQYKSYDGFKPDLESNLRDSYKWIEYEFNSKYNQSPKIPEYIELRDYQKNAIIEWFKNNGSGLLEMATGTGKTITALSVAAKLYEKLKSVALVIVCPYQHLVNQWAEEALNFGFQPILGYESRKKWEDDLNSKIVGFNMNTIDNMCLITTNNTYATDQMQKSLKRLKGNSLIIVDEVHHIGAKNLRQRLLPNFKYRLALSATPERWLDEKGNEAINNYFKNGVIFRFSLREAIGEYLTPYYYYSHIVELTEEESEQYHVLSKKIAKLYSRTKESDFSDNPALQNLLFRRARLIANAENKLKVLETLMMNNLDSKYNIFYCGDGVIEGERQIDKVIKLLGKQLKMKVHPFTARESKDERQLLLQEFEKGDLQGLVAIRCLDEGVDIPATQNAYILASSANPREFIQRRGRILRKHKNKKFAYIHDFIVIPRKLEEIKEIDTTTFNIERKLIKRELKRFSEFAELAINGPQASLKILEIKEKYNLLDI